MLELSLEPLAEARRNGFALAAFNIYNLEGLKAAVCAAEQLKTLVIIQTGPRAYAFGRKAQFGPSIVLAARRSAAPIAVQMDHARCLGAVEAAIRAGYTSVMVDGSNLRFAKNVDLVRRAADAVHAAGGYLEAELGRTAGEEDWSSGGEPDEAMTDPAVVAEFVAATRVDALAVSIGNVHGLYSGPPRLDFARLEDIAQRVSLPLVLHGASGIPPSDLRRAVELGIAKVNFNAELRQAYLKALEGFSDATRRLSVLDLMESGSRAIQSVMEEKVRLLTSLGRRRNGVYAP